MVSIVFFACNVRGKVPMGGQRGSSVSRHNKNDGILKTGQCAQYGAGGGGVLPEKKRFWQTPLSFADEKVVVIVFFKNTVKNTVKYNIKKINL